MSKGKRRSNPEALKTVRERLRCGQTAFTEADRELLMQLCRLDLIHILEVDLALGPLKSSQKNSVACMVSFLLSQQQQQDVQPVLDAGAAPGRAGGSPVPEARNSRWSTPAAAADVSLLFPGADGQGRSPSSGGGSCPTPSTAPDEQPLQQLMRPQTPMSDALGAAAPSADQPWLAELHEQLEAAGTMRYRLGDDTTDTDDDTNGTGATSSWVGEDLDDQQHFAGGGAQELGPPLDTSSIEEMLVQQLLLDMNAVPRHRAHRERSFNSRLEQRGEPQQQQEEVQREPPPLLRQKLQQLDEQQRLLKEQQRMQQERQQQELMSQQQQWQQREMRQQAEFDQMLQDELLHQLTARREAPPPLQPQLGNSSGLQAQQTAVAATAAAAAAAQLSPITAAPMGFCGLQQPRQITTWPLPGLPPAELDSSATAAAAAAAAAAGGMLGAPGLPLHGLNDASLPLPTPAWPGRASVDGGSGSFSRLRVKSISTFTRKREKVLMDLPMLHDEGPTGSGDDPELSVEPSGPSAELPTKRRSITLPGCTEVGSLPTSFSGKVAGPAGMQRPQLTDLQQLMQLSSCDDPADISWQVPQQMQYQQQYQQQQLPGAQVGLPQSGTGMSGITSKLKTLLRGHKLKAKARRCNTVGAGGSFSAAAGADTNRIPSADAALALQAAAAAAAAGGGDGYSDQAYQQQMAGQQFGTPYGSAGYAVHGSGLYMQGGVAPQAQDRHWHSTGLPVIGRNPSDCSLGPPVVGGFSWHASGSTMLPPGLAGVPQQGDSQHMSAPASTAPGGVAASSSQFAQQLAQLRAEYDGQQQETCGPLYPMQGSGHIPMPAQAAAAGPGTSDPAASGLECYAGAAADTPERLVTTGYSGDKSGIVGKLVRALKRGSNPAQASSVLGPTGPNLGGMEVCEEDEELLIMGRTDGEMDLARAALQWPESGAFNPREEVLHALRLQVQGQDRARAGAGEGPSTGIQ